jgi:enamine deaminase RidA (YjgF/YER057c/UK114 family)
MKKTYVKVTKDPSFGISALNGGKAAFSDAVRIDTPTHTLLYVSGIVGDQADGTFSRNMKDQARQAILNIKKVIEHEGGRLNDIVRFRIYVSAIDSASIRDVHEARLELFKEDELPASTLIRVDQFVRDGILIEIDSDVVMRPAA